MGDTAWPPLALSKTRGPAKDFPSKSWHSGPLKNLVKLSIVDYLARLRRVLSLVTAVMTRENRTPRGARKYYVQIRRGSLAWKLRALMRRPGEF